MARLFIGTSGWSYSHWRGIFYPQELPSAKRLSFYGENFDTAEVNYSFYHLPRASTYENWYRQTPERFVFALKASRVITHVKRLKDVREYWNTFIDGALMLKEKLGPILLQFPSSFRASPENLERLAELLSYAISGQSLRLALEFRHASCFESPMLTLLERHHAALVLAHSERFPIPEVTATAPFVYFRFHGPEAMFASSYSDAQLRVWSRHIKTFLENGADVYAYFNNDLGGHAVVNARTMGRMLIKTSLRT